MRLALAGSLLRPPPLSIPLSNGVPFIPRQYLDLGYTNFEVMCIGGGGGMGGGIKTLNSDTQVRNFGGAGGGGGLQRVRGALIGLPEECNVVVGIGGANGLDHISDPIMLTDGDDGGYSSFGDTICRASGGKGGFRAQSNSTSLTTQAHGGQGGVGGRIIAGGGALGGLSGTPTPTGPGTAGSPGSDGTWDGAIGQGGGGGAGGVGTYSGVTANAATAGGRGAFDAGDTSVYGLGANPTNNTSESGAASIVPGLAGGGRATPLNKLPTSYGQSGSPGYVVILVTAV